MITNPPASGELRVYASALDMEQDRVYRRIGMAGQGAHWSFAVDSLGGSYFPAACFPFGCGQHRDEAGELIPVPVPAGDTTTVALRF